MPRTRNTLVFLFLILLGTTAAFGQVGTAGALTGTVTTDGAPLPGATVTVSSPALQGSRTTVTGDGGGYAFPSLPVGTYTVTFELSGMQKVTRTTTLGLATTGRVDVDMKVSAVSEAITVTATAPAVLETTEVARNFTAEQVSMLPVRRNITDTVVLAPGVNTNGARNNISISGGASYDNLFMVNGVVVNENLRGQPHNLFIEDAIQESTVITGSISAEYGRFTGGVVSTITKSGGNEFTGSFRDNLTNPKWTSKTPFINSAGVGEADHPDLLSHVYEATLGGYFWKDRLWFFGAGRKAKGAPANGRNANQQTLIIGFPFQNTIDEDRYEVKLTAQVLPQHSIVASYLDVDTVETNNFFAPIYDEASIVTNRSLPNDLLGISYNGVITSSLLLEAQYSEKNFAFVNSGGRFTDQIKGTWLSDARARWNAPVFCGVCTPEERNNDSKLLKATYFVNTRNLGTHTLVAGGEDYHETRLVNNFQSASQFQIGTTGTATIIGSNIYPRIDSASVIQYRPILTLSAGSNLTTRSFFVNDKWDFNKHLNFNLGMRYDKNDAVDASGNLVSDDSAFSPRLGLVYDVKGDGRFRINASYSHYVTKITDGNIGGTAAGAGVPALFQYQYQGPVINPAGTPTASLVSTPDALKIVFDWYNALTEAQKNALLTAISYPGYTTKILEPISSPYVAEIVLGFGSQFSRRGYFRVDLIDREWNDFYQSKIDRTTGGFVTPAGQTGDLQTLVNDEGFIERTYKAAQMQFNWAANRWNVGGGYTWSRLEGNDIPEGDGTAGVPNAFGYFYPEYLNYEGRNPVGILTGDQTHRARIWAGYDIPFPLGKLNASVIQSYDSGRAFSAVGTIDATGRNANFRSCTATITTNCWSGVPANPGYTLSAIGTSHNYYFSERGAFRTDDWTSTDLALNYSLPIKMIELFVQGQVINVFNEDAVNNIYLGNMDFTVNTRRSGDLTLQPFNPHTDNPVAGTHYTLGPNFGKATGIDSYQTPRTYRFSVGLRF